MPNEVIEAARVPDEAKQAVEQALGDTSGYSFSRLGRYSYVSQVSVMQSPSWAQFSSVAWPYYTPQASPADIVINPG